MHSSWPVLSPVSHPSNRRKRFDRLGQILLLGALGRFLSSIALRSARLAGQLLGSAGLSAPRWLLPALPLAAALAFAIRTRMKVGGDVADVLATQKQGLGKEAEPEPTPVNV